MNANQKLFAQKYAVELSLERAKNPDHYQWPVSELDSIVERMTVALSRGSAHFSSAIKRACRAVGVKPTINDLKSWLNAVDA